MKKIAAPINIVEKYSLVFTFQTIAVMIGSKTPMTTISTSAICDCVPIISYCISLPPYNIYLISKSYRSCFINAISNLGNITEKPDTNLLRSNIWF
jgi:hypothetical protein